jgi:hypothetical protein
MKRRWLVLAVLLPALGRAAPEPANVALRKLEAELRHHLEQNGSGAPMPWRDAVVMPDTERLVWGARTLRWSKGRLTYRVALDPSTRWYYVIRADRRGPAQYFGPIDQLPDGRFVDWRSGAR